VKKMRAITKLADRMLSSIVPEVQASAAGCGSYWVSCGPCVAESRQMYRLCTYSANCKSVKCTPCEWETCNM
jgi:hypothetical protein